LEDKIRTVTQPLYKLHTNYRFLCLIRVRIQYTILYIFMYKLLVSLRTASRLWSGKSCRGSHRYFVSNRIRRRLPVNFVIPDFFILLDIKINCYLQFLFRDIRAFSFPFHSDSLDRDRSPFVVKVFKILSVPQNLFYSTP